MPKYKVEWHIDGRKLRLGTLTFNDDEAAISEVAEVCRRDGLGAKITRPDRKLTVAIIAEPESCQSPLDDLPGGR